MLDVVYYSIAMHNKAAMTIRTADYIAVVVVFLRNFSVLYTCNENNHNPKIIVTCNDYFPSFSLHFPFSCILTILMKELQIEHVCDTDEQPQ